MRRALSMMVCAAALMLGITPAARAAFDDPLFFYTPNHESGLVLPPPAGFLDGACGLAVNGGGQLYVSDYYHRAIDVFSASSTELKYISQPLAVPGPLDPHSGLLDDPCGLAIDAAGTLYVNNYHRSVVRFGAPPSLATAEVIDSGDPADPYANPTGVAVDPASADAYVDDRTYIAAYDPEGNPLEAQGGGDLRIGEGSLGDAYGIAVSGYFLTAGRLYVPDASTDTVKVFDPATDTQLEAISGPPGGFGSLQGSAVAVDSQSGEVYVLDTLGPQLTERPQATVYVFAANGTYEGRLKRNTFDSEPTGLAVDNAFNNGRVYLTQGNGESSGIYAYNPHSATNAALAPIGASPIQGVGAKGSAASPPSDPPDLTATASSTQVTQQGDLRIAVSGRLSPHRLPRSGQAPISVTVGGQIESAAGGEPAQLKALEIEINRNGHLDATGLPLCPLAKIQPASTNRALANCRASLLGRGSFSALVGLGEQEPYQTHGKLLLFNAKRHGKPLLYGQIYASHPFATSFVIPFAVKPIKGGRFGTLLSATLPASLLAWGKLTGIELTLSRRYAYRGKPRSYVSAGCPAPKGFAKAPFALARTTFAFEGGAKLDSTLTETCEVRG
jgi:DNA-binding beta-propeller fold protein YncE